MIPIPPLDGSKVLASILGFFDREWMHKFFELERYGFYYFDCPPVYGYCAKHHVATVFCSY